MIEAILFERTYLDSRCLPIQPIAIWGSSQAFGAPEAFSVIMQNRHGVEVWNHEIDKFRTLKAGWNGYDAEPPSPVAIDMAKSFLSSLMGNSYDPSRVAPSVVGGVGITHKGGSRRVYVEFLNDGEVLALFSDNISRPVSRKLKPNHKNFLALMEEIRTYLDA